MPERISIAQIVSVFNLKVCIILNHHVHHLDWSTIANRIITDYHLELGTEATMQTPSTYTEKWILSNSVTATRQEQRDSRQLYSTILLPGKKCTRQPITRYELLLGNQENEHAATENAAVEKEARSLHFCYSTYICASR